MSTITKEVAIMQPDDLNVVYFDKVNVQVSGPAMGSITTKGVGGIAPYSYS